MARKTRRIAEFGDFQTPTSLALVATEKLANLGIRPRSILEPTCGVGAFVGAAAKIFPNAEQILGLDINQSHLDSARHSAPSEGRIQFHQANFFDTQWKSIVEASRGPWLIIGNPPWVTSSELGTIRSDNVPEKSNFHGRAGIEAITGKSNFDISEWMLLRYLDWLEGHTGTIAVLCKTTVARKILLRAWTRSYPINSARIYKIDASEHFGAAVDACFFVLQTGTPAPTKSCALFESLVAPRPVRAIGFHEGHIISDVEKFGRWQFLLGPEKHYVWRSGIKHDCAKVMELKACAAGYVNGLGEQVSLEGTFLFPMLKSSDVKNARLNRGNVMLVTQQSVGQDAHHIKNEAPSTWNYLLQHIQHFDNRASSIYRNKPPYSIFGVGAYSFAPWKLAISGFYKSLRFLRVGPVGGKPIVFDDTVYFLGCSSEEEACFLEDMLSSDEATDFFGSMISWDEKRPITADLLRRLSIGKLATALHRERDYVHFTTASGGPLFAACKPKAA